MIYRKIPNTKEEVSLLGYGCMRFPRKNGRIDKKRTENQIIEAINSGVNIFDTAYRYFGSEEVLGDVLSKGYRNKVKIATKIPVDAAKNSDDFYKIFETQLKRLKTDYIDFYLIHSIYSYEEWLSLKESEFFSIFENEKKKGRIKNLGFSFHGNFHNFKKIIDDYDWDVCLVQYNYVDEDYQAGSEGIEYAASKNIGVMVMEPLKGGILVDKLPDEVKNMMNDFEVKKTPAEWAFRWVANNPNVQVILSGMNNEDNIRENIETLSNARPNSLTEDEKLMLSKAKEMILKKMKVQCTNCGYCLPCPKNVDIPSCFSSYNDKAIFGGIQPTIFHLASTIRSNSAASNCTKCGICEEKCPQDIPIMEKLEEARKDLEKGYMKFLVKIGLKIMP